MPEDSDLFEDFSTFLETSFKNIRILKYNALSNAKESEPIILLATPAMITKTRVNIILEEIKLLNLDIKGYIFLDPYLKI